LKSITKARLTRHSISMHAAHVMIMICIYDDLRGIALLNASLNLLPQMLLQVAVTSRQPI
jgi:hypothetical protein